MRFLHIFPPFCETVLGWLDTNSESGSKQNYLNPGKNEHPCGDTVPTVR